MKKLIGLGFILAAIAVITFSIIGYPKIDANLWPLVPVVLFAFFTIENALKKDYKSSLICAVIGFIIANAIYDLLPISNGVVMTAIAARINPKPINFFMILPLFIMLSED